MPAIRPAPLRLAAALLLALAALPSRPALAQEPAPAPEGEAQEAPAESPAAKPKPRPRKPPPKPKPEAEKPADPKPADAKPSDSRPAEAPPPEPAPTVKGATLEPETGDVPARWPNGASSVSESYGDWTMNCNREDGRTDCVVIQSQGDRRSGRRQFSIELRAPRDGRAEGLILMPFGLKIETGVTFKLDDRTLGKGAPYSHCVADGCLVPISLPSLATDTMKTAQNLTVSGMKPEASEPTVITVPLAGFAAAFARAIAFGG